MDRTKILAIIVVVIVIVAAVGFYLTSRPIQFSVSVATSTSVGTVGSPITFNAILSDSSVTVSSVVWNFGDGVNQTVAGISTTHTYLNGGRYLVLAQVTATHQSLLFSSSAVASNSLALFPLTVEPNLLADQADKVSVPVISFPSATSPAPPVFNAGDALHPIGRFLEVPTNSNWTIQEYVWDFGNGIKQTVVASGATGYPTQNVTATYPNPGLYPISLTIITNSNGEELNVTAVRTIAVRSDSLPFALLSTSLGSLNPGVITIADVWPGGPYSWDPQIGYETLGMAEMLNVFQALDQYNGSSTYSFIPVLAVALPTQENGGISSDYKTFTFQIRSDQYFSNGDPVTAHDVWFSIVRNLAFTGGSPSTPGWIPAQFLIPGVQNGTANVYTNNTWTAVTQSVTYDNATNVVTLHFNRPMAPTLVFQVLTTNDGGGVIDARYAWSVGAGFNEANWDQYKNQAIAGSYNTQMQWSPIGSGPYMFQSYTPGESVLFAPNPHYGGVPGIQKQTTTVVVDFVKTADTAVLMLQNGDADCVAELPPSDFPAVQHLQSQGLVNIYSFSSFSEYFYTFNIKIDKDLEATQLGTGFTEPSNYFADLPTRLAWINAYDYAGYLSNILGNAKYGATFGTGLQGVIPAGMIYYVPPNQLGGLPAQNLDAAKGNFSISAFANQKITIPIVEVPGDVVNMAAAEEWAGILSQISNGNINAKVVTMTGTQLDADTAQNMDPVGVAYDFWSADYPDPSDYMDGMYLAGGWYGGGNNLFASNFASLAPSTPYDVVHLNGSTYTQAQVDNWMNGNITLGDTSVDPAVRQEAYTTATRLAIALGLYAYVYQQNSFWYARSWLKGVDTYQENPMIGGLHPGGLLFYWLTKE
ncbi:MAG: ABC transporter substrate-binding protein [Candidatus Bathyarchaeia archaeon]